MVEENVYEGEGKMIKKNVSDLMGPREPFNNHVQAMVTDSTLTKLADEAYKRKYRSFSAFVRDELESLADGYGKE